MNDVTISKARSLDAGAIGNILSATNDMMPWLPRVHSAAEEIKYAGDMIEAGWIKIAKVEGRVLGFIAVWEGVVYALYVMPDAQDAGIGTALLDDAKSESEQLTLWSYQKNSGATRFYGLRGFVEVERSDGSENDTGLADIRFEWKREQRGKWQRTTRY